jgi:DNA-binding transcriptional ArsR family regulator
MMFDGGGDPSRLFRALADPDRRVVLYYLREHESASLETLADLVTGWAEAGPGPDRSVARDDVRAGLHHVHLPALDAAGLVSYDSDGGRVTCDGLSPTGEAVLDAALAADTTEATVDLGRLLAAADDAGADDGG